MPSKDPKPTPGWPEGKAPATLHEFYRCLEISRALSAEEARRFVENVPEDKRPQAPKAAAIELIKAGKLTRFQAQAVLQGKIKYLSFGEYIVLERLGRGGMGEVLKAEHRRMQRMVALKVISGAAMKDADAVRRFQREVHAAARLIHANIVTAFDANEHEGVHFLVMEYVDGKDLAAVVHEQGSLPVATAVDYVLQAARGLAYAHGKGIVHRDIKPGNLLVDREGTVKILDMGLARIDLGPGGSMELTSTGQVMGTVDYMAPEQAEDTHSADARADIYSLGCTLYRLLSGDVLYSGESVVKKLLAHRGAPIPPLAAGCPAAPAALDAVFRKMVAKRPEDRQQSMAQVVTELEQVLRGLTSAAPTVGSTEVTTDLKLSEFFAAIGPRSGKSSPTATAQKSITKGTAATEVTQDFAAGDTTTTGLMGLGSAALAKPGVGSREVGGKKVVGRRPLRRLVPSYVVAIAAALGGLALAAAGIVVFLPTSNGTIRVEINDPSIEVTVSGSGYKIKGKTEEIHVKPGEHTLHVKTGELEFDTSKFVLGKGDNPPLKVELLPGKVQVVQNDGKVLADKSLPATSTIAKQTPSTPPAGGFALEFDGKSSMVVVPSLKIPEQGPTTIEAWVTPYTNEQQGIVFHTISGIQAALGSGNRGSRQRNWGAHFGNYNSLTANDTVNPHQRVHLACVWEKGEFDLYVGGIRQRRAAPVSGYPETGDAVGLRIGAIVYGQGLPTKGFDGLIDGVRVSNIVRYTKDFTPQLRFESDANTLALYNFDEGQGDVLKDSSGNGHYGKIVGAKWVPAAVTSAPLIATTSSPWTPRAIAEWVLERGGIVVLADGREIANVADLPPGDFSIGRIGLGNVKSVGDEEAKIIAEWPAIRGISVNGTSMTDAGLRRLAALELGELLFVGGPSFTGEGFDAFEGKRLGILKLSGDVERKVPPPRFTPEAWRRVAAVGWTPRWALSGSNLTDEAAQQIATRHPEITHFGATVPALTDAGLEAIAGLPRLRDVSFSLHPGITDAGVLKFKATKTLELLHAWHSLKREPMKVTAAAFDELHQALPACKIIWGDNVIEPIAPKKQQTAGDSNNLFNGQNLSGWQQKGHAGWSVKDGLLTGESMGAVGWLMSEREFGDFELELEYRLPPGGNSGVFLRAPENGNISGGEFNEIQLLDDSSPTFANVDPKGRNGALFSQIAPTKAPVKAANEWRNLSIRCTEQTVNVTLDGVEVLDGPLRSGTPARGHIGLQLYSPGVAFRNIRIRELSAVGFSAADSTKPNYALEFDGKDSYVNLPTLRYDGSHPITLEATIIPYQVDDAAAVISDVINRGTALEVGRGRGHFLATDGVGYHGIDTFQNLVPRRPIHLAALIDGRAIRLYADGKLQHSNEFSGPYLPGRSFFRIGVLPPNGGEIRRPFSGVIDEVRVSKVARYDKDFTPTTHFEPDNDTLALYHFDEGQGDVLTDSSGNGHHGKIVGATWVPAESSPRSVTASPTAAQPTIDLLSLVDLKRDAVSGQWRTTPEGLVAEASGTPGEERAKRLQLPYTPPEEYDFEIEVTPAAPNFRTTQHLWAAGRSITWEYDSKPAGQIPYISGFARLDGLSAQQSPEALKRDESLLTPGGRNRSRIEVRRGSLRVLLDDKLVAAWQGDLTRFSDSGLRDELPDPRRLGVITFQPAATFHKITVREVTGRGQFIDGVIPAGTGAK